MDQQLQLLLLTNKKFQKEFINIVLENLTPNECFSTDIIYLRMSAEYQLNQNNRIPKFIMDRIELIVDSLSEELNLNKVVNSLELLLLISTQSPKCLLQNQISIQRICSCLTKNVRSVVIGKEILKIVQKLVEYYDQSSDNGQFIEIIIAQNLFDNLAFIINQSEFPIQYRSLSIELTVNILSNSTQDQSKKILKLLQNAEIVLSLNELLMSGNDDLTYWTIGLLHEFVIREIYIRECINLKYLPRQLIKILGKAQSNGVIRVILRLIITLIERDDDTILSQKLFNEGIIDVFEKWILGQDSYEASTLALIFYSLYRINTSHESIQARNLIIQSKQKFKDNSDFKRYFEDQI